MEVYVMYSDKFDRLYVGMSQDPDKRLLEHNSGKTQSTKAYRPWQIIHKEEVADRMEGRKREKHLKSGSGREYIRKNYLAR